MNEQKICIIGDGLTGLSTAVILGQENLKIDLYLGKKKVIKKDDRTTAISESSFQFIKQKINIKNFNMFWPCKKINLFFEDKKKVRQFLSLKENKKKLMYIFKNNELKKNLDRCVLAKKNIKLIKKNITSIDYEDGSILLNKNKFFYDLIILCTGHKSKLYDTISHGRSIEKDYKETALTTSIKHNLKTINASQYFLKEGPFAILPFKKNVFSVVWSVSNYFLYNNNKSLKIILSKKIKVLLKNIKIKKIEKIKSYPINLNLKTKYFRKNILILGDGLHVVHPMAGQGFNLVLRDIKKLSELVSKTLKLGISLGNSFTLNDFYQSRKSENTILGLGINLTNIFFKENKYFAPIKNRILKNINNFDFINKISKRISNKGISI